MRKLGLERTGYEIRVVKEQTRRLFASRIEIERCEQERWTLYRMDVAAEVTVWWDPASPNQVGLWGSRLKVGEQFYNECLRSPVPLDERALRALKGSSFDLDLYAWLVARLFTVRKKTLIPWELLRLQFGTGYPETGRGLRNFRAKFIERLQRVSLVYPGARVQPCEIGLWLDESLPAVHRRLFHNPR